MRWRVSSSGSTSTVPSVPSTATTCPTARAAAAPRRPTTAGTPSERARIATWLVLPPSSMTKPRTLWRPSAAVSDGVRLREAMTLGTAGGTGPAATAVGESAQDPLLDVAQVVDALAEGVVLDLQEARGQVADRPREGRLGVDAFEPDRRQGGVPDHLVLEDEQLAGEDGPFFAAQFGAQSLAEVADLLAGTLDGDPEALDLDRHVLDRHGAAHAARWWRRRMTWIGPTA